MIQAGIAFIAVCTLIAMSVAANRRFKDERRLPMQWSANGSVNWTAPRAIALAFTPVLAAISLLATAVLTTFLHPKAGQGGFVIPTNIVMALIFIGAHALHLSLIRKSLRPKN